MIMVKIMSLEKYNATIKNKPSREQNMNPPVRPQAGGCEGADWAEEPASGSGSGSAGPDRSCRPRGSLGRRRLVVPQKRSPTAAAPTPAEDHSTRTPRSAQAGTALWENHVNTGGIVLKSWSINRFLSGVNIN